MDRISGFGPVDGGSIPPGLILYELAKLIKNIKFLIANLF